jgi:hypothetical protein
MLALNFFNVRVLPSHVFGWNRIACLFKSIAPGEASLFCQVSQAMSVNSITVSSNFLRLKPAQKNPPTADIIGRMPIQARLKPGGLRRVNYGHWVCGMSVVNCNLLVFKVMRLP